MLYSPLVPGTIGYSNVAWQAVTDGALFSDLCTGLDESLEFEECCESCANLQHLSVFKYIRDRHAKEGMEALAGYNHPLLTLTQLRSHTRHHKDTKDARDRDTPDADLKVAKLTTTISQHKHLVGYVSQNHIPCIHQLISVQLRAGGSQ
jgi:hypothetical protein